MTIQDITTILEQTQLPVAYYQFQDDTPQELPFICWLITSHNDVMADNINYAPVVRLVVELYTESKDFALEETVRGVLTDNDIAFTQDGSDIDSEQMHLETFTTELAITQPEPTPETPGTDEGDNTEG